MEGLSCTGIVKTYKDKKVLQNINLTLEKGKIYGLIGRNGAGKTTLLSVLTAQNPATEGEVLLDGEPVWENQRALDRICFSRELSPIAGSGPNNMKVKEYLKIAGMYLTNWDKEMEQELIRLFGVDSKQRISKLSKGMLSMVTIIVAMASGAEYTFLDEPVAGLDVVAREQFYHLLLEEYTKTGRTFVISTHIIEEAANILEEVIILKEGSVLLKENTQELLERCVYVSGKAEEVDLAVEGLERHHEECVGRSKSVMVMLKNGEQVDAGRDVNIQSVNLQRVFLSLCGEEERRE